MELASQKRAQGYISWNRPDGRMWLTVKSEWGTREQRAAIHDRQKMAELQDENPNAELSFIPDTDIAAVK